MSVLAREMDVQEIIVTAKVLKKTTAKLKCGYLYFIELQQYNRIDTNIEILIPTNISSTIFSLLEINNTYKIHIRVYISDTKTRYKWVRLL